MCPFAGRLIGWPRLIAHCLVLETARDGLVLVDSGFGTRDVDGRSGLTGAFRTLAGPTLDAQEPAVVQLARLGYKPADLRHVVVTHLDLDHAGGIADFPHATIHVHAREHAAAMTRPSPRERQRYHATHWAHGPTWSVYTEDGDTWRGLPAVTRLRGIDADIGLLPMHGHTRGHSAVIANAGDRWLVHAGDAYFHRHAMADGKIPLAIRTFEKAVEIDAPARRASVSALRQLHASYSDVALFCAHDTEEFAALAG